MDEKQKMKGKREKMSKLLKNGVVVCGNVDIYLKSFINVMPKFQKKMSINLCSSFQGHCIHPNSIVYGHICLQGKTI
jgi:hypothetical protein